MCECMPQWSFIPKLLICCVIESKEKVRGWENCLRPYVRAPHDAESGTRVCVCFRVFRGDAVARVQPDERAGQRAHVEPPPHALRVLSEGQRRLLYRCVPHPRYYFTPSPSLLQSSTRSCSPSSAVLRRRRSPRRCGPSCPWSMTCSATMALIISQVCAFWHHPR